MDGLNHSASAMAPTERMPEIQDEVRKPRKRRKRTVSGAGLRWRAFRRSIHGAVRSPGAWFLAVCVGALAVSLSWLGWVMSQVSSAAVSSAAIGGRGIQESLPESDDGFWLALQQVHAGWFIAAPLIVVLGWIVVKEAK